MDQYTYTIGYGIELDAFTAENEIKTQDQDGWDRMISQDPDEPVWLVRSTTGQLFAMAPPSRVNETKMFSGFFGSFDTYQKWDFLIHRFVVDKEICCHGSYGWFLCLHHWVPFLHDNYE